MCCGDVQGGGIEMEFIIGGAFQGKLDYCIKKHSIARDEIFFAGNGCLFPDKKVVCGFHMLVKDWLEAGFDPLNETRCLLQKNFVEVFISDEIGNGIVPVGAFEREWREKTGRCSSIVAQYAESVVRIFASMEQVIK